jgi:L-histidine N-alpha-methyltransferase
MTQPTSETEVVDLAPERSRVLAEVLEGLDRQPREFPSLYLYDDLGSQLFDKICEQPEYYPTRTELSILRDRMEDIRAAVGPQALVFEPGAGSGLKTRVLLEELEDPAGYVPIEISRDHLDRYVAKLQRQFPDLWLLPVCADFHDDFELPPCPHPIQKRVVFFPGSTIGNMVPSDSLALLKWMRKLAGPEGGVMVGVDLQKDRQTLEAAYNDAAGVSAAFALNILTRLNDELDADFDMDRWTYEAVYNEQIGRIEMYVVSKVGQRVKLGNDSVLFKDGERVRTEWSYKYSPASFAALAEKADLRVAECWTDADELFSVQYLVPA